MSGGSGNSGVGDVRMVEVARACGVSQSTVSRAFANSPRIPEATRKRILETAERLGYRRDAGASHLISRRWRGRGTGGTIAYLRSKDDGMRHHMEKVREVVAERGLSLDELDLPGFASAEQAMRVLRSRGIVGVLVTPARGPRRNAIWPELAKEFALVVVNHRTRHAAAPVVVAEAYHRMTDAWTNMWANGYRRIGVALPRAGAGEVMEYLMAAHLRCCQVHEISPPAIQFYDEETIQDVRSWVEQERLDGILDFERVAFFAASKQGLRIPEDIGYASLRNFAGREVAGMLDNRIEVVRNALELVEMMIRSGQTGASLAWMLQEVRCRWMDGLSCPPRS